ncbi:restriction endonuclease, partial [Streptomyces sp. NPDC089919]|uniref:restriction endonuclease n=1 Tax=Streptomyces sp. NPDC089919 TaxID=3155188 RepID=UPI003440984F
MTISAGRDDQRRRRLPGRLRKRDVVLALGLVGILVGGLALGLKTWSTTGTPVAACGVPAVFAVGGLVAAGRRRTVTRGSPAAEAPAVRAGAGAAPAHVQPDVPVDHHALDPAEFEHAVAALCARDGCTAVEVSGGAGDLGADVVATTRDGGWGGFAGGRSGCAGPRRLSGCGL